MKKIIILGHENPDVDSVVSGYLLQKILKSKGVDAEFVIPDAVIERDTLEICSKYKLNPMQYVKQIDLNDKDAQYILVDHHERKVAGEIICIIDHHPTKKKITVDNYFNTKISSTACYICRENQDLLNIDDIRLAVIATLVDTASFHSDKTREVDKQWVLELCEKHGFDYNTLYEDGLCLTPLDDVKNVCFNGIKRYMYNNLRVESSYIQVKDPVADDDKIKQIIETLVDYVRSDGVGVFVFIVHDMTEFKSMYYLITEGNIQTKYYDKYSSRGNTIMPEVEGMLPSLGWAR